MRPRKKMAANDLMLAEKQLPKVNPSHLSYELLMSFNAIDRDSVNYCTRKCIAEGRSTNNFLIVKGLMKTQMQP